MFLHNRKIIAAILTFIIFAAQLVVIPQPTVFADYEREYLFYDDFSATPGEEYLTNSSHSSWGDSEKYTGIFERTDGKLKVTKGGSKNYAYFGIPADKIIDSDAEKFVVEWDIDIESAAPRNMIIVNGGTPVGNSNSSTTSRELAEGKHYALIDCKASKVYYYYPGCEAPLEGSTGAATGSNLTVDFGCTVYNGGYNLYDYIAVYPFGGMGANLSWESEDGAERDKVDLLLTDNFMLPDTDIADYLLLDGEKFNGSVVQSTENPLLYTLTFEAPLAPGSEHTISISNLPCIMYQNFSKDMSFAVKGGQIAIDLNLESGALSEGAQTICAEVLNETEQTDDLLLIAALYSEDGKMKLFEKYNLSVEDGNYEFDLTVPEVESGDSLELFAASSFEALDIIGTKTVYTAEGVSYEKRKKLGSVISEAEAVCDTDNLTETVTVTLPDGEEDRFVNLVVLKPGTTKINERNIYYLRNIKSSDGVAEFEIKIPDKTATYSYIWYSQEEEPKKSTFEFTGSEDGEKESSYLFYDEFDAIPSEEYIKPNATDKTDFPNFARTDGRLVLSKSESQSGNWARFIIPSDVINAASSSSNKFVIEWQIDITGGTTASNRVSVNGSNYAGFNYGSIEVKGDKENGIEPVATIETGTYYAVYDKNENTLTYYHKGLEPIVVKNVPKLPDGGFNVMFEAITKLVSTSYGYIKIYSYGGMDAGLGWIDEDGAEPDSVDLVFSDDIIPDDTDLISYIKLDGEPFVGTLTQNEDNPAVYTLEFAEPLEYGSAHTLSIVDAPCIMYQTFSKEMSFSVRGRKMFVVPTIESEGLIEGVQTITAEVENETASGESISLIAVVYSKDGNVKNFKEYELSASTGNHEFEFEVSDVEDGDVLEIYAAEGMDRLEIIGKKTVYTDDGISYEEKAVIDSPVKSKAVAVCDTDELTETVTVTLPEGATDRYVSLAVLKPGASTLSESSMYYIRSKMSDGGKAEFKIPMSDTHAVYPYIWYSQGEVQKEDSFTYYTKAFSKEGLGKVNKASMAEMKNCMNTYAEALGIVIPDEKAEVLDYAYKAFAELRDENYENGFLNKDEASDMFEAALFIARKKSGDVTEFVKEFNEKYSLDAELYEGYSTVISKEAKTKVNSAIETGELFTVKSVKDLLLERVILDGNYYADNYTQTKWLIENLYDIAEIDTILYNKLTTAKKNEAVKAVSGKTYTSIEAFNIAFVKACQSANDKGTSGGSSGGSGGVSGGGSGHKTVSPGAYSADILTNNSGAKKYSTFSDMQGYEWAIDYVEDYYDKGIINGKSSDSFAPADKVTRAEIAKILSLALELEAGKEVKAFSDVSKGHWAYEYVTLLSSKGLINGISDGVFGAEMNLTRQMLVTILYRAAGEPKAGTVSDFADIKDAEEYSKAAIRYYQSKGAVEGVGGNMFMPKSPITRAEAVVMVAKCLNVK